MLSIYQRRKLGWDSGQLKYSDSLYTSVCHLVHTLQNQLPDDIVEFTKTVNGNPIFKCNGIEIGRFPINEDEINA